jgi:hypothetical protein
MNPLLPSREVRITRDAIFHYVCGVLHDPVYCETYAINVKRAFPRIPFHPNFWAWADWGRRLMEFHLGYEQVETWPMQRHHLPDAEGDHLPKLKDDTEKVIDLSGRVTRVSVEAMAAVAAMKKAKREYPRKVIIHSTACCRWNDLFVFRPSGRQRSGDRRDE